MLFARWATAQKSAKLTLLDIAAAVHSCPADFLMPGCETQITIAAADVAMAEVAAVAGRERVDGVMHAAGVLRDALLLKQTSASFREVLSGKASALYDKSWNLAVSSQHRTQWLCSIGLFYLTVALCIPFQSLLQQQHAMILVMR